MTQKQQIDEKKQVGVSIIYSLHTTIDNYSHFAVQYRNLIREAENRFEGNLDKIEESQRNIVIQQAQYVSYYGERAYIYIMSLSDSLAINQETIKEITLNYEKLIASPLPDRNDVLSYNIVLTKFILNSVVKELLDQTEALMSEMYDDAHTLPKTQE